MLIFVDCQELARVNKVNKALKLSEKSLQKQMQRRDKARDMFESTSYHYLRLHIVDSDKDGGISCQWVSRRRRSLGRRLICRERISPSLSEKGFRFVQFCGDVEYMIDEELASWLDNLYLILI